MVWIRDYDKVAFTGNTLSMRSQKPHTPLRTWRRAAAFKQKEIARLLGLKHISPLSRIERGKSAPGLALAIGIEVLTGHTLHEILGSVYEEIQEETLARVTALLMQLESSAHPTSRMKCRYLRECQDRVITKVRRKMNVEKNETEGPIDLLS